MAETLVVYALVAVAATWVVWRLILPSSVRQGLKARMGRKPKNGCESCGR